MPPPSSASHAMTFSSGVRCMTSILPLLAGSIGIAASPAGLPVARDATTIERLTDQSARNILSFQIGGRT